MFMQLLDRHNFHSIHYKGEMATLTVFGCVIKASLHTYSVTENSSRMENPGGLLPGPSHEPSAYQKLITTSPE